MENFSSGLLYSVPPEYISQLHLNEDLPFNKEAQSDFTWPTTGYTLVTNFISRLRHGCNRAE